MTTLHNLGFPRIGAYRELKFGLEAYWQQQSSEAGLRALGAGLRQQHWQQQSALDYVPVGDFSFYDHVLDMSVALGNLPARIREQPGNELDHYFRTARGRAAGDRSGSGPAAGEMTKWFDTNYHYIVPEFLADTRFEPNPARLIEQVEHAMSAGHRPKPVIIGPLTYLALGKARDHSNRLTLLERLLPVYAELLQALANRCVEWVQIDEPILVTELDTEWRQAFRYAYHYLRTNKVKLLLTTYFGELQDNLQLIRELPVDGLHLDAIRARHEVTRLIDWLPNYKILSLGVIDGRNIWKTDLSATLDWLEPIAEQLHERLWLAPSCSLLHVPVDLDSEVELDPEIKSWLAFARQKLDELTLLSKALQQGRHSVAPLLEENAAALRSRRTSVRVKNPLVQQALQALDPERGARHSPYAQRAKKQAQALNLPAFPTTTIGSFPQTAEIRQARKQYRAGELDTSAYAARIKQAIEKAVREQERLGLDVLVHGEAERNDMVEYFGQQLDGFAFNRNGWVQSYGSRCVKPPILFGDIGRPQAMTVEWTRYAQSLTGKPMKGMLTGPVTLLNWSFVRDDQPRAETCRQLALAMREEVLDLERAGILIIQIDEAALREGLPLRRSQWKNYLGWAVDAFRIAANGVGDGTQIHTHMCYSEFNDIIEAIARMDADVITIETSRSNMELLDAFDDFRYPNEIGPGVYDIHSPNIPGVEHMVHLIEQAAKRIPARRLWVNPDCGLKTRDWEDVLPALSNMVKAAHALRAAHIK